MTPVTELPLLSRYEDAEAAYRPRFAPIPVGNNEEPLCKEWTNRNPSPEEIADRIRRYPNANTGLLAGTVIGSDVIVGGEAKNAVLAFVDIDDDRLVAFALAALRTFVSGKKGAKGLTVIAQAPAGVKSCKIHGRDKSKPLVEFFVHTGMVVIPPSLHPKGHRYEWIGTPLLEADLSALPVVTEDLIAIVRAVLGNENAWTILDGGADVAGHQPMLALTSSGIASLTDDLDWLADCLAALFHPDYKGDTKGEILGMLKSAKAKGLGSTSSTLDRYEPGDEGPIPLGYLADGRFVFFEQTRRIPIVETSNRLTQYGCLLNLAPASFWENGFGSKGKVNTTRAGITLMQACRERGGFDESRVRGRGVYVEKGHVVRNFGSEIPLSADFTYICHIPLKIEADEVRTDPADVLEFFQLFNWNSPSAAYMLFGWMISAIICGALTWRTHVFLTGAKNTGKTTLVNAIRSLLDKVAVALDGTSSEAGIRQKLGADSRPVIIDEFESDQNLGRMRQIIKLMRSASSGDLPIARGTPEGKALEFSVRSSFLLAAINAMAVTAADRSRIVSLALRKHDNDKTRARQIAQAGQKFQGMSASWCLQVIDRTVDILASVKILQRVFPPCDSRHALNMSTLLGAAWTMLNGREIDEASAETLIAQHWTFVAELSEAHEENDAEECLYALLQFRVRDRDGDRMLGDVLGDIKRMSSPDRPKGVDGSGLASAKSIVEPYGLKWEDGGLIVANSHRGLAEIYKGTLWEAGTWGSSLKRLPGATATAQRRFAGDSRSLATLVPAELIPDREEIVRPF